ELASKREAIPWNVELVALEPTLAANKIAMAGTAIRIDHLDLAHTTLEAVGSAGRANVKYHQLAGALAIAEKKLSLAETEFAAALQIEPNNQQLALNVATIRLTSSDPATREQARADLARL